MVELPAAKPLEWMGNTRRVVQAFPKPVRQVVGQALYAAQIGDKHIDTKPLKGFGGAGVVEVIVGCISIAWRSGGELGAAAPVGLPGLFEKDTPEDK
jgi:phage-related protein